MGALGLLKALIGIAGGFGVITNSVLLYLLLVVTKKTRLTTILILTKCWIDGYTCFIALVYKFVGNEIITSSEGWNKIFCTVWFADNLIWIGAIADIQCTVCLTLNMLLKSLCSKFYHAKRFAIACLCYVYLVTISVLLVTPNFLFRKYHDGYCGYDPTLNWGILKQYAQAEPILYCAFNYIFPVTFVITAHGIVIAMFAKEQDARLQDNISEENMPEHDLTLMQIIRRKFMTTMLMACVVVIGHAYDAIHYALRSFGQVEYMPGSTRQQLGLFLIILNCAIQPLFALITVRTIYLYLLTRLGTAY